MILSDFHTLVRDELKRGDSVDAIIPTKTRQAIRELQRNYSFIENDRFVTLEINASVEKPRAVEQPVGFKAMQFWRIIATDGYHFINKIEAKDAPLTETGEPSAFWLDGSDYFWLNNTPDINYSTEMLYTKYDDLNGAEAVDFKFLTEFEALSLAATMVMFGFLLKDDKMFARYKASYDALFATAKAADEEKRQANSEPYAYGKYGSRV